MLIIDFIRFVGSKKNRGGSEKNRLFEARLSSLVVLGFAVCLELVVYRLFWLFCFFILIIPNRIIFSSIESIVDATGLERSRYQINWDLSPCSIDPPQHHLFTERSLLSGRRVGERAVNHPGFVRTFALNGLLIHTSRG